MKNFFVTNQFNPFSVAICTQNRVFELKRLLRSVLRQSVLPSEIIIIDSTKIKKRMSTELPNSLLETMQTLASKRIKVKYKRRNYERVGQSRNFALKQTKCRYLFFLDDDVVLVKKHFFRHMLKNMREADVSTLGMVCKVLALHDNPLSFVSMHYFNNRAILEKKIHEIPCFSLCSCCLDLSLVKKYKMKFNEKLTSGEDTAFFLTRESDLHLFYDPNMTVKHDFYRGNIRNFFTRFFWYGRGIAQLHFEAGILCDEAKVVPTNMFALVFSPLLFLYILFLTTVNFHLRQKISLISFPIVLVFMGIQFYGVISAPISIERMKKYTSIV